MACSPVLVDTHCHLHLLEAPPEQVVAEAAAEGSGTWSTSGSTWLQPAGRGQRGPAAPGVGHRRGPPPRRRRLLRGRPGRAAPAAGRRAGGRGGGDGAGLPLRQLAPGRPAGRLRRPRPPGPRARQGPGGPLPRGLRRRGGHPGGRGAPPRVVFHCFAGDEQAAARVVEAGWYVSFAGTVTFRNAPGLRAACAVVPLDRMVLETDSPFLSPTPTGAGPTAPGSPSPPGPWPRSTGSRSSGWPRRPRRRRPGVRAGPRRPCLTPPGPADPGRVRSCWPATTCGPARRSASTTWPTPTPPARWPAWAGSSRGRRCWRWGRGWAASPWPCARPGRRWWPWRPTPACSRPWPRSWATTPGPGRGGRRPPGRPGRPRPQARRLVANLPYNIAATLVLKVLAEAPAIAHQVVMVQREVGERLAAAPGRPPTAPPAPSWPPRPPPASWPR